MSSVALPARVLQCHLNSGASTIHEFFLRNVDVSAAKGLSKAKKAELIKKCNVLLSELNAAPPVPPSAEIEAQPAAKDEAEAKDEAAGVLSPAAPTSSPAMSPQSPQGPTTLQVGLLNVTREAMVFGRAELCLGCQRASDHRSIGRT